MGPTNFRGSAYRPSPTGTCPPPLGREGGKKIVLAYHGATRLIRSVENLVSHELCDHLAYFLGLKLRPHLPRADATPPRASRSPGMVTLPGRDLARGAREGGSGFIDIFAAYRAEGWEGTRAPSYQRNAQGVLDQSHNLLTIGSQSTFSKL